MAPSGCFALCLCVYRKYIVCSTTVCKSFICVFHLHFIVKVMGGRLHWCVHTVPETLLRLYLMSTWQHFELFTCSYLELAALFIVRAFTCLMFAAFIRFGFHWVLWLWFIQPRVRSSYMAGHCHATGYPEGDVHATSSDSTGRHIEAARGHHASNAGRTGVETQWLTCTKSRVVPKWLRKE